MVSANKIEILRIAETVAQEKMIEKEIVLSALEELDDVQKIFTNANLKNLQ